MTESIRALLFYLTLMVIMFADWIDDVLRKGPP